MSEIIQINYQQLLEVQKYMQRQEQIIAQLLQRLEAQTQRLATGWEGRGSQSFFNEMTTRVLPTTRRLHSALHSSSATINDIIKIIQAAEREAAAPFHSTGHQAIPINSGQIQQPNVNKSGPGQMQSPPSIQNGTSLLDQAKEIMTQFNTLTLFAFSVKQFADGFMYGVNQTRVSLQMIPWITDNTVAVLENTTVKKIIFSEMISNSKWLSGLNKGVNVLGIAISGWNFVHKPNFENGFDLGVSGLSTYGAFATGPGALLAGSFAIGYTAGQILVPGSVKEWAGDKLADWDPLDLGNNARKYPRTTIKDFERHNATMPQNTAIDVFKGLQSQYGMGEARKFAESYAKQNDLDPEMFIISHMF